MSLKFIVQGIEVTATDAVEAAKLIRELAGQYAAASQAAPTQATPPAPSTERPRIKIRKRGPFIMTTAAVRFLTAIKEAGNNGMRGADLMEPLRTDHPKGIGSRVAKINEYLTKLGFEPEQVYRNPRTAEGRLWTPGPKLDAALEAAKKVAR